MKKRVRKLIMLALVVAAIAVSLIQLRIPVVRAEGCPPGYAVGCGCEFRYSTSVTVGEQTETICYYSCFCGQGGSEPMEIEREITVQ